MSWRGRLLNTDMNHELHPYWYTIPPRQLITQETVYIAINCVRVLDERNTFLFNVGFKWRSAQKISQPELRLHFTMMATLPRATWRQRSNIMHTHRHPRTPSQIYHTMVDWQNIYCWWIWRYWLVRQLAHQNYEPKMAKRQLNIASIFRNKLMKESHMAGVGSSQSPSDG
jgi:hypothetical protein